MNQPKLFPGVPRKPELSVLDIVGQYDRAMPAWFYEDVYRLFDSEEIYEIIQGVGQLIRFADGQPRLHIPPYWRTHWLDCFFFELDETITGFQTWSAMPENKYQPIQRSLQYRRDALEANALASRHIGGPKLEFELLRADREMEAIFRRKAVHLGVGNAHEERRLAFTKQHFKEAWWASK